MSSCKSAIVVVLIAFTSAASAGGVSEFRDVTKKAWTLCSWYTNIAGTIFGDQEHYDKTSECVSTALNNASSSYSSNDASSKKLVKPYYAKWMAAMKALPSLQTTSKGEIESSISQSSRELEEAWALVEIDLQ